MKLLCFSDLHLTNKNAKFRIRGGVSDLLRKQEQYVDWLCTKAVEEEYDAILFLGDWTDYPTLDPTTLSYSNRLMKRIAETQIPSIILEGNHCITDKKKKHTVVGATAEIMKNSEQMNFVFQDEVVNLLGYDFFCVPYSSNYKQVEKEIAEFNDNLDTTDKAILLFHLPSINAVLDNGVPSKKGVNLSEEITSNFVACIGGDFHRHQQLVNNPKAWYVGAPFDLTFGDHEEVRGVMSVSIVGDTVESVELVDHPHKFPIKKIEFEEFEKLTEEDLQNGIFKVVGDLTDEQRGQLIEARKNAYRLDFAKPKFKSRAKMDNLSMIDAFNPKEDARFVSSRMKATNVGDDQRKRVVKLFEDVKGEVNV